MKTIQSRRDGSLESRAALSTPCGESLCELPQSWASPALRRGLRPPSIAPHPPRASRPVPWPTVNWRPPVSATVDGPLSSLESSLRLARRFFSSPPRPRLPPQRSAVCSVCLRAYILIQPRIHVGREQTLARPPASCNSFLAADCARRSVRKAKESRPHQTSHHVIPRPLFPKPRPSPPLMS